jgi:hypothetical protein
MSQLYIPDISYQLIFCNLTIHELSLIARCCKDWKRIVFKTNFLNMFRYDRQFVIEKGKNINIPSTSPFHKCIRNINIIDCFHVFSSLIHFQCLESLHINISSVKYYQATLTSVITPVFKALCGRLRHLEIIDASYYFDYQTDYFPGFFEALSLLSLLNSLKLCLIGYRMCKEELTFLSHMKQLNLFNCDGVNYFTSFTELQTNLRLCPELTQLNMFHFFHDTHFSRQLKELCICLQQSKITHIGHFTNIHEDCQNECVKYLNELNCLQTIGIEIYGNHSSVPSLLGQWIQHLDISYRSIVQEDVLEIIRLPFLKSIHLILCNIDILQMNKLMNELLSHSSKIQVLKMMNTRFNQFMDNDSGLNKIENNNELMKICSILKTQPLYCDCQIYFQTKEIELLKNITEKLTFPSDVFPILKDFKVVQPK